MLHVEGFDPLGSVDLADAIEIRGNEQPVRDVAALHRHVSLRAGATRKFSVAPDAGQHLPRYVEFGSVAVGSR